MQKIINIKPVKTIASKYDQLLVVKTQDNPFTEGTYVLGLINSKEDPDEVTKISADFVSVPDNSIAYDPDSYSDSAIAGLEKQGLLKKLKLQLHSGFNNYPVYKMTDKLLQQIAE